MENDYEKSARVFKAFCDENRLRVLEQLRGGEMCGTQLLERLNIGQSTLSHHMKVLCESGVVVARRDGKWIYYSISEEGKSEALVLLYKITEADKTENN